MIDPKDLREMKASDFKIGCIFYLKMEDGSFSTCQVHANEVQDPRRYGWLKHYTEKFLKEGRLFVNRNNPGKSFVK